MKTNYRAFHILRFSDSRETRSKPTFATRVDLLQENVVRYFTISFDKTSSGCICFYVYPLSIDVFEHQAPSQTSKSETKPNKPKKQNGRFCDRRSRLFSLSSSLVIIRWKIRNGLDLHATVLKCSLCACVGSSCYNAGLTGRLEPNLWL